MSASASGGSKRVRGTVVVVPVVHGSVAVYLGKKSDEVRTHKWTAYLRGANNQDISYFIKQVEFNLHESFDPPKRIVTAPPYEVTETGWGEFEVNIRVVTKDVTEKPIELFHLLRLFPPPGTDMTKKPVASEHYDELIFQDPPENLLKILKAGPQSKFKGSSLAAHFSSFDGQEARELKQIENARKKLREEKLALEEKYNSLEREREELVKAIIQHGGKV
mmetsp:Transcript_6673/g.20210  ORF Transcript_6673/g.20210 Transcript_6673/m.20210 type:complete len:220 (+) Transcript_6673:69-728(+)|eukprot:CAMPEP_0198727840 /NCGR_PEP_ID=MMETSP1475-20131203/5746_1 /TAXON_ID= ORGANISM="Unidentified sp., Strain CCMP1999" /NCGR_SAMPLE_ID=MMETSP1475 /ASSEMBLY_ACC=CAM_ASM_001111 /LENGTH=219 /DNA_ID=CAMNT_0044490009 /DNA_START=36 /DNA_END=695 /DNA_ORIENTATION=+